MKDLLISVFDNAIILVFISHTLDIKEKWKFLFISSLICFLLSMMNIFFFQNLQVYFSMIFFVFVYMYNHLCGQVSIYHLYIIIFGFIIIIASHIIADDLVLFVFPKFVESLGFSFSKTINILSRLLHMILSFFIYVIYKDSYIKHNQNFKKHMSILLALIIFEYMLVVGYQEIYEVNMGGYLKIVYSLLSLTVCTFFLTGIHFIVHSSEIAIYQSLVETILETNKHLDMQLKTVLSTTNNLLHEMFTKLNIYKNTLPDNHPKVEKISDLSFEIMSFICKCNNEERSSNTEFNDDLIVLKNEGVDISIMVGEIKNSEYYLAIRAMKDFLNLFLDNHVVRNIIRVEVIYMDEKGRVKIVCHQKQKINIPAIEVPLFCVKTKEELSKGKYIYSLMIYYKEKYKYEKSVVSTVKQLCHYVGMCSTIIRKVISDRITRL